MLFALWLPKVIRVFAGVMVCFTQASSCEATGGAMAFRPRYDLFDNDSC